MTEATSPSRHFDSIDEVDLPRAMLTDVDREWLLGLREYDKQNRYERRKAVAERVTFGLADFNYLRTTELDEKTQDTILDRMHEELDRDDVNFGVGGLISLLYNYCDGNLLALEAILSDALHIGLEGNEPMMRHCDVSIEVKYADQVDTASQKLEEGETDDLTPAEVNALVRAGELDAEDLEELAVE